MPEPQTMNAKIGCAVIGHGGMGHFHSHHMRRIEENPDLEFIGAYDIVPERSSDLMPNEKGFSSLEELLADDRIQLVTVATPNDLHKEIVIKALEAGKHVVCEKPVTMTLADLDDMIAAAQKANRIFTVHQNRRWDPDYLAMKNIFDKGTLGKVFCVESRVHGSRGIPGDWRNQKEHGGGMVLDWGVHILDQMLMMTRPRKLVSLYSHLDFVTNENCDDGFHVEAVFDDGLVYRAEVGTSNFIALPRWYMLGENGSAKIDGWDVSKGEIVMVSDWENRDAVPIVAGVGLTKTMAPRTDDTIKRYPIEQIPGSWNDFYRNVCAAIKGTEKPIVTLDEQRRLIRLLEIVFDAAEKGEVAHISL